MGDRPCPRCGQTNNDSNLDCKQCGAAMNRVYVDCYVCGGTGAVVIDYTDEYEAIAGGDPILPCGKCEGKGRLPRDLVNAERRKVIFWRILEHFG